MKDKKQAMTPEHPERTRQLADLLGHICACKPWKVGQPQGHLPGCPWHDTPSEGLRAALDATGIPLAKWLPSGKAANLTDEDYRNIAARLATPSDDTRSEGREQVVVDRETWEYLVSNDTPSEGLRAAAQRVVAAFDNVTSQPEGYWSAEDDDALDALRAALSAPPQETVDTGFVPGMRFGNGDNVLSPQESPDTPNEWPPLIRRTPSEEAAWHEGYAFGMKMAVAQSAPSTEETPQESPGIDVGVLAQALVPLGGFAGHPAAEVWREGSAREVADVIAAEYARLLSESRSKP